MFSQIKSIMIREELYWNLENKILQYKDKIITLTKSESILLGYLIQNLNKSIHSEVLFYEIFDYEKEYTAQSIRMIISKLRKKIPCPLIDNIYGSEYIIRTTNITNNKILKHNLDEYLYDIIDQISHGIVITNPNYTDNPVIYVNKTFLDIFLFNEEDIIGKNCRVLQYKDNEQNEKYRLKEAIEKKESITVKLKNYKKDLTPIFIELTVNPIFCKRSGDLKYFIGLQKVIEPFTVE